MKVMKFGGTSVGSATRICNVGELISDSEPKVVVLSAMSGTTNTLVQISDCLYKGKRDEALSVIAELENKYSGVIAELFKSAEYKAKATEYVDGVMSLLRTMVNEPFYSLQEKIVLAQGELMSTHFMHYHLLEEGTPNTLIPALDFMRVDKDGEPDYFYIRHNLAREIELRKAEDLIITQGFICRNNNGDVDNLKRGGSDYSAALVGQAIKADEIQIWTDIDGFHNNDPRIVEHTKAIRKLSFDEAAELAYFGAKILHPSTVSPAKMANIPVRLKNTMNPNDEGTLITHDSPVQSVKAVAAKDGITAIRIVSSNMLLAYGFLRKVFEVFEKWKTPIDMIATSEVSVSLTIDDTTNLEQIMEELRKYGTMEVDQDMTIICLVGDFTSNQSANIAKVMNAMAGVPIRMISYGGIDHNVSFLVKSSEKVNALTLLNNNLLNVQ